MFRSLLIPVDLGPSWERLLGRATLLPLEENARLTLLHVVPKLLPSSARKRAAVDARKALAIAAGTLSARVGKHVVVQHVVTTGTAAVEIAKHARSVKAELIVMGRGGGRTIRDLFLGSTAERVIRRGQLPVLVVRLAPRSTYRKPAVAVNVDRTAHGILSMLLRVVPVRSKIVVIHAYDPPYHGFVYPSLTAEEAEEYEEHYQHKALREIAQFLSAALRRAKVPPRDAPLWSARVRHGSARAIVAREVKKTNADLLALGTHAYTGVAHAFLGSVAGDVLRGVPCDVLVVPPR